MKFTKSTPRKEVTIQGSQFSVPQPFKEGDTINENEAAALNQTLSENIRNNLATKVKEAMEAGTGADTVQSMVDDYVSSYEFGQRTGGGGGSRVDPVVAEMRRNATDKVKNALRDKGYTLKDIPSAKITELRDKYIAKNEADLRAAAEKVVAIHQEAATEDLDIDLGDVA